jgi:hypothetical protein
MKAAFLLPLTVLVLATSARAQAVKDREGAVRQDRSAMENDARWIYNDVERGFAEAKRTGKPLLVVLRCVPCLACSGIDAQVLLQETDLVPLLDQFVRVRIINANALDLSLFQFDYDLSFSTMFFNGDGTVYGRYGSWSHQKNAQDKATAGYKRALEAALAIHKDYPANKAALAGKQAAPMAFRKALDIPTLSGKYRLELDWNGKVVPSCVHCHQISDALRLYHRKQKEPIPSALLYSWPPAETVGLTLAQDHIARVELVSVAGQPLVSIADVSWALHRAPENGSLALVVKRGGSEKSLHLDLADGWRAKGDISRRVGTWGLRGMATGGLVLENLSDQERDRRGLKRDSMALLVKYVGEYGSHAAAKKAGFKKDDVVTRIDGLSGPLTEGEVIGGLLQNHQAGDKVKTTVLRGSEPVELELPVQ